MMDDTDLGRDLIASMRGAVAIVRGNLEPARVLLMVIARNSDVVADTVDEARAV